MPSPSPTVVVYEDTNVVSLSLSLLPAPLHVRLLGWGRVTPGRVGMNSGLFGVSP